MIMLGSSCIPITIPLLHGEFRLVGAWGLQGFVDCRVLD